LLFGWDFQLAVDIDVVVIRHRAFARLALEGVGLGGKAVYTHKYMSGISNGSLVAHNPLRKPPSDN
jgi:hypothetical protein